MTTNKYEISEVAIRGCSLAVMANELSSCIHNKTVIKPDMLTGKLAYTRLTPQLIRSVGWSYVWIGDRGGGGEHGV